MESPIQYLLEKGLGARREIRTSDVILYRKSDGEEIGRYSGFEATHNGMCDATPEMILEEYIKPIVEKYDSTH